MEFFHRLLLNGNIFFWLRPLTGTFYMTHSRHSTSVVLSSEQYATPSHVRLFGKHIPLWHFVLAFSRQANSSAVNSTNKQEVQLSLTNRAVSQRHHNFLLSVDYDWSIFVSKLETCVFVHSHETVSSKILKMALCGLGHGPLIVNFKKYKLTRRCTATWPLRHAARSGNYRFQIIYSSYIQLLSYNMFF